MNFSVIVASKKSKRRQVDVDGGEAQSDALKDEKATRRTKRRGGEDEEVTGGIEATEKKTTKKRRKQEKETTLDEDEPEQTRNTALDTSVELLDEKKKKKKKKKRKKESASAGNDESSKKKTGLPDPGEDTLLSDQARKALTYAYTQFDDPARWKFHKARQNWLIRNVWSDQIIPETYMPLLTRYLSNIKGGVRDNLITACKSILSQSSTVSADPSPHLPAESKELVTNPKQLRARVVLDALT
ncbi:hypothetical protein PILCRDRAFT_413691 [Piloderma croceum F 1598]|uniref:WKF domain-containing protein n=1 Tax=Piloderma croceum (strain F 1598) TaxID=765440 RepID=A0A0C3FHC6_PILCF|nr:hypothetical protein PILCRDRAFT_413691 [Piloderma croceum F 1598]